AYDYTFDAASNMLRIDDRRPGTAVPVSDRRRNTQIFGYDDLYRLTSATYSFALPNQPDRNDGSINYTYDRIGNMLSQTSNINDTQDGFSVTNLGALSYGGTAGRSSRNGRKGGDPPGPHALSAIVGGAQQRAYTYDDNGNIENIDGKTLAWDF